MPNRPAVTEPSAGFRSPASGDSRANPVGSGPWGTFGRPWLPLLLMAVLTMGCSSGGASAPSGPVVSPTGVVYPPGSPPVQTRFSQTATLYLRADDPDRALKQALVGIDQDPTNPIHHFLAGVAATRVGLYPEADSHLRAAEQLYPAYAMEIEPEREAAWAEAFNRGAEAYSEGRVSEARRAWEGAVVIHDLRAEAHRNLAMLLTLGGEVRAAVDLYYRALEGLASEPVTRVLTVEEELRRATERDEVKDALIELLLIAGDYADAEPLLLRRLARAPAGEHPALRQNLAMALEGLGRDREAAEIYESLLGRDGLEEAQLFNLGIRLFRTGSPERAGEAFGILVRRRPYSRDLWFNYLNALFASEAWDALVAVGDEALSVDPLNETVHLILARAHLERGDEAAALAGLDAADSLPVFLDGLTLRQVSGGVRVEGRMIGNAAVPGDTVTLRFDFHGPTGPVAEREVHLSAPAAQQTQGFEVEVEGTPDAFRYRLVRPRRPPGPARRRWRRGPGWQHRGSRWPARSVPPRPSVPVRRPGCSGGGR